MFRWPVQLSPLSLGGGGRPRAAVLDVSPRGAAFTLASLTHVGHAAHLALVDAYLKGQVRLTPTAAIGEDSRTLVASLAAPLLAAAELGLEHLTLADLILLPRNLQAESAADLSADGQPTRSVDCARFLLRAGDVWHWVRGAERFERAGCLGATQVGVESLWHDVVAELPDTADIQSGGTDGRWPVPISAEVRAPSASRNIPSDGRLIEALRRLALIRFARSPLLAREAVELARCWPDDGRSAEPLIASDFIADIPTTRTDSRHHIWPENSPADLGMQPVRGLMSARQPALAFRSWNDLKIDIALMPNPDGYQTLCLLPPADADGSGLRPLMLDATRALLVGLIGRPLAEHRSDPIALSLRVRDGDIERVTTLQIGESIAIVRNQTVFAAWVGSDGRATIKLFPPGGMSPP